jgi:Xaa-Pro dipeptidase
MHQPDIFYLCGYPANGVLIITESEVFLYLSSVSYEEVKRNVNSAINCIEFRSKVPWDDISLRLKGKKIALDPISVSQKAFKNIESKFNSLVLIDEFVSRHRVIKEPEELQLIRKACRLTAKIFAGIDVDEWVGKTERELASYLEQQAWMEGGSGRAFEPVVAADIKSAYPHHKPSNDIITKSLLKIDYGIIYDGYCSDLTRTFILDKFFNDIDAKKIYQHLVDAQKKAVDILRPGVKCLEVYECARSYLKKVGFDKYFIHGLGHGVGIEIHEKPYLRQSEQQQLEEGMVVTVEPGIYMPGIGGMRIEDTFLINKEGAEKLTGIYQ